MWGFSWYFSGKLVFSPAFVSSDVNIDWRSYSTFFTCSFVARIFGHALEGSHSKSALVHSFTVCISLLDSKRSIPSFMMYSFRSQHVYESPMQVSPDTIGAMLPKLGKFLFAKAYLILNCYYVSTRERSIWDFPWEWAVVERENVKPSQERKKEPFCSWYSWCVAAPWSSS